MTQTDNTFEKEVLQCELPVLVVFYIPWSGAYRALEAQIEALTLEYQGRVKIFAVNADEKPGLLSTYGVPSAPSLLLFRSGKPAGPCSLLQSPAQLKKNLEEIKI